MSDRTEHLTRGNSPLATDLARGISIREFCSGRTGARNLTTGMAIFEPKAEFPCHTHKFSEALTILKGSALVSVEGRRYQLRQWDCIHLPAGSAHSTANASPSEPLALHYAFATAEPRRTFVETRFEVVDRGLGAPQEGEPEFIARFDRAEVYPLAEGTKFRDLFASRFGSKGICGGYGEFQPGTGLPCHLHKFDESITIVKGRATCQVAGRSYSVGNYDTAMVPTGLPHRFLNEGSEPMAMIWVYAGDEPERTIVEAGYCEGSLKWNPPA